MGTTGFSVLVVGVTVGVGGRTRGWQRRRGVGGGDQSSPSMTSTPGAGLQHAGGNRGNRQAGSGSSRSGMSGAGRARSGRIDVGRGMTSVDVARAEGFDVGAAAVVFFISFITPNSS